MNAITRKTLAPRRPRAVTPSLLVRCARRSPIAAFLLLAFGFGWPTLIIPWLVGIPVAPFLLLLVFGALLGPALALTRIVDGPGSVRVMVSRAFQWRFGFGRWVVVLWGVPLIAVTLAAATGTLSAPQHGWIVEIAWYLFNTLVFGALTINIWEETAWAGFTQSRLIARHGLLVASVVTAALFAAIHVPLQFAQDGSWSEAWPGLALLFAAAPVYRYLLGIHLLDTRGSVLAVGVQHASWNAAQRLDGIEGGAWNWQVLAATLLLTFVVALTRRVGRPRSRPIGRAAEMAAAKSWTAASTFPIQESHRPLAVREPSSRRSRD